RHAGAARLEFDRFLCLLLGAHEEHHPATADHILDPVAGLVQQLDRLLQVDDVDAIASGEDVPLHLGIPTAGLMTKMDASFEKLLQRDEWHRGYDLLDVCFRPRL